MAGMLAAAYFSKASRPESPIAASVLALLMALVKRADERFRIRENFFQAIQTSVAPERLDACLRAWLAFVPKILPVAKELIRLRPTDADAAAAWEDRMVELRSWLRELIASLRSDGALLPAWAVDEATDYLWSACSVQVWELLVVERGWSAKRANSVLRKAAATVLLGA